MPRRALGVLVVLWASAAGAQRVPGRDLLTYPLGLTGEAAALGSGPASGLWNPASGLLASGERGRVGASALNAPIDLALSAQVFHGAWAFSSIGTITASLAHAAVTDLVHTETDPQSLGGEIPYNTFVLSAGLARRVQQHIVAGVAIRSHTGHVESQRASAVATDAGVVFDRLGKHDARLGLSTFLWTFDGSDAPVVAAAADVRAVGTDTLREGRFGLAYVRTRGASTEYYPYAEARYGPVSLRGGMARLDAFGSKSWRMRVAVAFRHAGYTLALLREENESGLSPTYQLAIANVFR